MTLPPNSSLTARLLHVLEQLLGAGTPNSISDVHAAVEAILGPVGAQVSLNTLLIQLTRDGLADLKTIADATTALQGVNVATLSDLLTEGQFDTTMALVMGKLLDIDAKLDSINAAIGGEPYNSLEVASVRGLLSALLAETSASRYGTAPSSASVGQSTGEVIDAGRIYAVFTPPITGVTMDAAGINLTAPWVTGWEAYIQTTDPAPQVNNNPSFPNRWFALDTEGSVNFSVGPAYTIRVYLKAPSANQNCRTFSTQLRSGSQRFVFTPEPPHFVLAGYDWALSEPGTYFEGWKFTLLSGPPSVTIANGPNPNGYATKELTVYLGETATLTGTTGSALWTQASAPATMTFCPPLTPS